ncbi:MAG: hypothetical protein AB1374_05975 [Bacillota bacterium]
MLPLPEFANLILSWVDTGAVDPRLLECVCGRIAAAPPDKLAAAAASGADPVGRLAAVPGAVRAARAWLGKERLGRLAQVSPQQSLHVVNLVIDNLLERHPAHGLILFAHKDWALRLVVDAVGVLTEAQAAEK